MCIRDSHGMGPIKYRWCNPTWVLFLIHVFYLLVSQHSSIIYLVSSSYFYYLEAARSTFHPVNEFPREPYAIVGIINRNFKYLTINSFVLLYKGMVRSHLLFYWRTLYICRFIMALSSKVTDCRCSSAGSALVCNGLGSNPGMVIFITFFRVL